MIFKATKDSSFGKDIKLLKKEGIEALNIMNKPKVNERKRTSLTKLVLIGSAFPFSKERSKPQKATVINS